VHRRGGIVHWDDVEAGRGELGHLAGTWRDLGHAAGSVGVGVQRIEVDAGKWSTPLHRQTGEEEIFYVLDGSGISLQDDEAYEVRTGDCLVHLARGKTHTLRAGDDGLDVLAFGTRNPTEIGHLPRAGVAWLGRTWVDVGQDPHPWEREVEAGEPEVGEPAERPVNIVNLEDAPSEFGGHVRALAEGAGSELTGLNWVNLPAGEEGAPPHCHSADEEIFVVLEGEGTLELWPGPQAGRLHGADVAEETQPLRRGSVISRPPGTRVAHAFRAGPEGLTYLAYGTREPNDIAYYPRSNKIFFRGVGLIARLESLDYDDGEPAA
jgi:uncharacterized cupin superfamily protein